MKIRAVRPNEPDVQQLIVALTDELALGEYTAAQTFGYSAEQLEERAVHLVGAYLADNLVGIGGLEVDGDGTAELKRFYVRPVHRGSGVADAILASLLDHAAAHGCRLVRLETGDQQQAAMNFYRRHGFVQTPRFGPYVDSETSVCMQRVLDG